jgi:hypothetical protein
VYGVVLHAPAISGEQGHLVWRVSSARISGTTWSSEPRGDPIPATAFVIRFPDGDFEYDVTRRGIPAVGDTLRRRGSLWSVLRTHRGEVPTVFVEEVGETNPLGTTGQRGLHSRTSPRRRPSGVTNREG